MYSMSTIIISLSSSSSSLAPLPSSVAPATSTSVHSASPHEPQIRIHNADFRAVTLNQQSFFFSHSPSAYHRLGASASRPFPKNQGVTTRTRGGGMPTAGRRPVARSPLRRTVKLLESRNFKTDVGNPVRYARQHLVPGGH